MRIKNAFGLLLVCLLFVSCEKDVAIPQYIGFADNYLSMRVGSVWVYQVDSVYRETARPDKVKQYFEKHVIVDSVLDKRILTYRIEVLRSDFIDTDFENFRNYEILLTDSTATYRGPKLTYLMLKKPMALNQKWHNGHTGCYYNQGKVIDHQLEKELGGEVFQDVLEIEHCSFYVFDQNHGHRGIYGRNVGLVQEYFYSGTYNRLARSSTLNSTLRTLQTYEY